MPANIQKLWDEKASTYSGEAVTNFRLAIKHQLIQKWSTQAKNCLDVGVADGIFSIELAHNNKPVFGVDISPGMLRQCRQNFQANNCSIRLAACSADVLPFVDDSFDLVFSFATLAIVPDINRAFAEIYRTLKPGGIAILDITGKYNLSQRHWNRFYRRQGHFGLHAFSLSGVSRILVDLGFEILEVHPLGFLDQWKYIPGVHKLAFLEKVSHSRVKDADLDYRVTRILRFAANHWYIVLRKKVI